EIRVIETGAEDAPVVGEEPDEIPSVEEEVAQRQMGAGGPEISRKNARSSLSRKLYLLLALSVVFVAGIAGGVLLLPRTIVMYSLPDGRLLSPREVQSALDRAHQRQLQQQPPPAEPPAKTQ